MCVSSSSEETPIVCCLWLSMEDSAPVSVSLADWKVLPSFRSARSACYNSLQTYTAFVVRIQCHFLVVPKAHQFFTQWIIRTVLILVRHQCDLFAQLFIDADIVQGIQCRGIIFVLFVVYIVGIPIISCHLGITIHSHTGKQFPRRQLSVFPDCTVCGIQNFLSL